MTSDYCLAAMTPGNESSSSGSASLSRSRPFPCWVDVTCGEGDSGILELDGTWHKSKNRGNYKHPLSVRKNTIRIETLASSDQLLYRLHRVLDYNWHCLELIVPVCTDPRFMHSLSIGLMSIVSRGVDALTEKSSITDRTFMYLLSSSPTKQPSSTVTKLPRFHPPSYSLVLIPEGVHNPK